MIRNRYAYGKLFTDYNRTTRASAYAYWLQASRFERQARERGDFSTMNFQKQRRMERENQLIEFDAAEGGNI